MDANVVKREPPHSTETEQCVIGCMIYDKDALVYASEHLTADEFYNRQYGLIFEAMVELNNENKAVNSVTLQDRLRQKNAPAEVCDLGYLGGLVLGVPSTAIIDQYCSIVHERAMMRKLIKTSENIANRGYGGTEDSNELLLSSEKEIFDLIQKQGSNDLVPINKIVMNSLNNIQQASKSGGSVTGVPTGFVDLDYKTAGMQRSDLVLIAARPSMGKTAFVLNIAEYAAFRKDYCVAIFSLEMSKEQLVNRLLAMESKVDASQIRTGNMSDTDWDRIVESAGIIGKSNLMIDDTPGISIAQLRSRCRKMSIDKGLDMIIIDYLQLMSAGGNRHSDSRQQEISDISRSLKALARELNVPVLALSQLSRAVEQRPDHRPMLSDLRESGAIEQDADVVMFIYRDDYYNHETEKKDVAEIIVAKQRNGAIGTVELTWMPRYTKFGSIDKKMRDQQ